MGESTAKRGGYAVYLCAGGCVAECPCAVRACEVPWSDPDVGDDSVVLPVDDAADWEFEVTSGEPCVVNSMGTEGAHPERHIGVDGDNVMHQWSDGDTECELTPICDSCGENHAVGACADDDPEPGAWVMTWGACGHRIAVAHKAGAEAMQRRLPSMRIRPATEEDITALTMPRPRCTCRINDRIFLKIWAEEMRDR